MQQFGFLGAASLFFETLINFFFCLSIARALQQVKPENREIQTGLIWLFLIPVFNIFWIFFIVSRLAGSLKNEFLSRDYDVEGNPGYKLGMAMAVLPFLIYLVYALHLSNIKIPSIQIVIGILGLIRLTLFIQYWMKINWYRKVLESEGEGDLPVA